MFGRDFCLGIIFSPALEICVVIVGRRFCETKAFNLPTDIREGISFSHESPRGILEIALVQKHPFYSRLFLRELGQVVFLSVLPEPLLVDVASTALECLMYTRHTVGCLSDCRGCTRCKPCFRQMTGAI